MKKNIMCLIITMTFGLSMIGCNEKPSKETANENLAVSTTENSSTTTTETSANSVEKTPSLDYSGEINDVYGDRTIISYEDKKNNQVVYMAIPEHDSGNVYYKRNNGGGRTTIQNSYTSISVSKLNNSTTNNSNDSQFKYCGIVEDIYGDRAIMIYEDTKYNKVIYLAIHQNNNETSIAVSNLNINNDSSDEILVYKGITEDIYGNRSIINYEDKKHNKVIYLAVNQNNNDTNITVTDKQ